MHNTLAATWLCLLGALPLARGVAAAAAAEAPRQAPLLSVVVTNYYQPVQAARAVKSIVSSAQLSGFDDFEVIIVHDGLDNKKVDLPPTYARHVRQLVKEWSGLAASRNHAIATAEGTYVMCLDGDDYVRPGFFQAVAPALRKGTFDVVQTDMANKNWALLWAPPAYDAAKLPKQNQFHASAIFRKALWEAHPFRAEYFFGWEDWDFWLRISRAAATEPLAVRTIREPLFVYTVGSMHGFCVDNHAACRAVFRVAHGGKFERAEVVEALLLLLDAERSAPLWSHKQYALMRRTVGERSDLAAFLRIAELLAVGRDAAAALEVFDSRFGGQRGGSAASAPLGLAAATLIDLAALPADLEADALAARYAALDALLAPPAAAAAAVEPTDLYHSFVSRNGPEMAALLHVSLASLIRADGRARPVVWSNVALDVSSFGAAATVVPMSPLYFARKFGDATHVAAASAILRHSVDSKYFRTHITDVLRYSVLSRLGGSYHDLDVVFRPALATSRVRAAVGVENFGDYGEIAFLNGAVMLRFERANPFVRECLEAVVGAHDPAVYNSIGPALVTSKAKAYIAAGRACVMERCGGTQKPLTVLRPSALYKFHWNLEGKAKMLETGGSVAADVDGDGVLAVHLWNGLWHPVRLAKAEPRSLVGQLLEESGLSEALARTPSWIADAGSDILSFAKPNKEEGAAEAGAAAARPEAEGVAEAGAAAEPAAEPVAEPARGSGPRPDAVAERGRLLSASGGTGSSGPSGPVGSFPCSDDGTDGGAPLNAGTVCRVASTVCDAAEVCDGATLSCPPDAFAPSSTVAHPSVAPCDAAETCSGSDAAVPADVNGCAASTTVRFPAIDFGACCGTGSAKADFLQACSTANAPLTCVDVTAGSAVVTFTGTVTAVNQIQADPSTVQPFSSGGTSWDIAGGHVMKADGEACSSDNECAAGRCFLGTCMAAASSNGSSDTTVIVVSVVVPVATLLLAGAGFAYYSLVVSEANKGDTGGAAPAAAPGGTSPQKPKRRYSLELPAGLVRNPRRVSELKPASVTVTIGPAAEGAAESGAAESAV